MPASSLTINQICTAIDTSLGEALVTAGTLTKSLGPGQLEEGVNDPNVLQIYPELEGPVSTNSGTQKITLGDDPYIDEEITVIADYYAQQRAHIGEDMAALITGIDAIRANLKGQNCPNPFDLEGIANFQWSWERVVFAFGEPELKYVGARFRLVLRTF